MEQSLNHWSAYWRAGARHSLPQDFEGNYDREIARFWSEHFSQLDNTARLLDLCTGSGAIAMLAHQSAPPGASIVAVDGAHVEPETLHAIWGGLGDALGRIEFIFGCPIEELNETQVGGLFDLVTSQYGLEYCNLEAVSEQLVKLIKPHGRLVMMTHATDSDMSSTMSQEAGDYKILDESGYLKLLASWSKNQISGQDLSDRLTRISNQLAPIYQKSASPLLAQVLETNRIVLAQPMGEIMAQASLAAAYLEQLAYAQSRLEDMRRVTQLVGSGDDWLQPLLDSGLVLQDTGEIRIDGSHVAGKTWVLARPA